MRDQVRNDGSHGMLMGALKVGSLAGIRAGYVRILTFLAVWPLLVTLDSQLALLKSVEKVHQAVPLPAEVCS